MKRVAFLLLLLVACGGSITDKPDGAPDAGPDAKPDVGLPDEAGPPDAASNPDGHGCVEIDRFTDQDGDGFGVTKARACPTAPGFAPIGGDCDDTNADVHPGQTAFFTVARADKTFDYDCDAKETRAHPDLNAGFCVCSNGQCSASPDGWDWNGQVPACGVAGDWFAMDTNDDCNLLVTPKTQGCR